MGKVAVGKEAVTKEEKVMLFQGAPRTDQEIIASFDEHAVAIAKRQYFMPEDKDLLGMFRRVSNWVASPEHGEHKRVYAEAFYDLMTSKRFCPGGRVLAGAGTQHGNVLNCFVQDGSPQKAGTNEWVTGLATKLALVTKVGGGNGLCLDPLSPKRTYTKGAGQLYVTIATNHADYEKVKTGTYMDLVHGKYVTKGYRYASFIEQSDVPASLTKLTVGDSVDKIWSGGSDMIMRLLKGEDVLLDLSGLRPEGTPVNGSGGNSSGPSSFAVEVFDNFAYWASLGGADYAGPVATLRYIFSPTLRVIRQGGTRRGAGMATMSITHPDIQDFITSKDLDREQSEGDISTFNISVLVTDGFMAQATKQGKQGVLWDIADHAWQTGEPGLIYIDRINEQNAMRESLGDIKSTNPCFPADVRIATSRGLVTLGELYETQEELMVMSDRRVLQGGLGLTPRAAIPVFKTGENKEIYRLVTKHGYEVRATHNHQFLTPNGWVELKDLQAGDTLFLQSAEGMWSDQYNFSEKVAKAHVELVATAGSNNLWGSTSRTGRSDVKEKFANLPTRWSRELGTFMGFMLGDGFISEDKAGITFANADYAELASQIQQYQTWFAGGVQSHENCKQVRFGRVVIGYLKELGFNTNRATEKRVPEAIFHAPREAVVGFLQGLFTSDGTVNLSCGKKSCSIRLASSSKGLLQDVQMLLSNFGIMSRIYHRREAGEKLMTDGRGGEKLYSYADQYELLLDKINRDLFVQKIGFLTAAKQNRVLEYIASKKKLSDKEAFETTVAEIRFDGVEDVYDTTESVAHSVIANGVVSHQCGEIPLYAGEPCDLGAINLAAYVQTPNIGMKGFDVEGFSADVRTCIRFLDNVLEVNKFALEDNRQMSLKLRRLGLGVMGLADALIMMGYRYDDEKGRNAVAQMIGELRDTATEASEQLAKERGAFPGIKDSTVKTERRNVAVLTVAPTGTTSMLMGVSSGVEPVFAPFVFRKIGDAYASLIHPLFQELLERSAPHEDYTKDGKWDLEKVVQAVQDNHGSVQGLDFIPDDVKAVLICAHDISPEAHVRMQGVVQSSFDGGGKQIANSISKTINMPNEATVEDVFRAYSLAFETGCKGITVYRDGSRQFQVLSTKAEKKEDQKSFKDDTTTSQAPVIVTPPVSKPASAPTLPNALTASRSEYLPGEPLFERPGRLSGFTDVVKLMLPTGEKRGFYVTVNSQDGLPTEVFIVSGKAGDEANADSEALGRMVSIALQYGVPAEVVVKTLRGINGGMYGTYQGRMAASKADLIAIALETAGVQNVEKTKGGKSCPECGGKHLRYEEGCVKCDVCGYSKCG